MKPYVSVSLTNDWEVRLPAEAWPNLVRHMQEAKKVMLTIALEGNPVILRVDDICNAMLVTEEAVAKRKEHDLMLDGE